MSFFWLHLLGIFLFTAGMLVSVIVDSPVCILLTVLGYLCWMYFIGDLLCCVETAFAEQAQQAGQAQEDHEAG